MPILTFNAKTVDCEILEKTLVGRKHIVDEVFKNLHTRTKARETYQSLLVAPRGSGKTHLTKLLYCRIKDNKDLKDKMLVAYMVEDEYGVASFLHFCLRVLEALDRYNEVPEIDVKSKIREFSMLPSKDQLKAVTTYLNELLNKRVLIVLVENLDNLLSSMSDKGAGLRDYMHNYNCLSLIATAQNLTPELENAKNPFCNFFKPIHLENLSFEEAYNLMLALIEVENVPQIKEDLNEQLIKGDEIKNKIRAIYELTGGNHRLLVHFFGFLKSEIKSELSDQFAKQMNDLKSYYEQFVDKLPVQQQRIVQILSLNHKPMQGKEIAQQAFLDPNSISKQLSELGKKGFVDVHRSGRSGFYEIKEPLMRICIEINENPDGSAKLFVDFLKIVYSDTERKKRYLQYKLGAKHHEAEISLLHIKEARFYAQSFDQNDRMEVQQLEKELQNNSSKELLKQIEEKFASTNMLDAKLNSLKQMIDDKKIDEAIAYIHSDITSLSDFQVQGILADLFMMKGEYDKAIQAYLNAIEINPEKDQAFYTLGIAYYNKGEYDKAIQAFLNTIEINPENDQAFYTLGIAYRRKGEYDKAIKAYLNAIEINPENDQAFNNLGIAYGNKGEHDKAIQAYLNAIEINPADDQAFYNLGNVYGNKGEYDKAIRAYLNATEVNPENFSVHNSLALVYLDQNLIKKARKHIQRALEADANDTYYRGTELQLDIYENNWSTFIKNLIGLLKDKNEYNSAMLSEDVLNAVLKWIPEHLVLDGIKEIEEICAKSKKLVDFKIAFVSVSFPILTNIENYSDKRIAKIAEVFEYYADKYEEIKIPHLMISTGIKHLKEGEKNAIYDLSKEERKVYTEQVLDKRKRLGK